MEVTKRPRDLPSKTYRIKTGFGPLYVTIVELNSEPFEVFCTLGKSGGTIKAKADLTGRLVALALRHKVSLKEIIEELVDIQGERPATDEFGTVKSIPDAVGQLLREVYVNND